MTAIDRFTAALELAGSQQQSRGNWQCLAHEDRRASLSVTEGRDGRAVVKCHAGCTYDEIIASVPGVAPGDLTPSEARSNGQRREIEAYTYTDEDGAPLYEVVRFANPKDFRQRKPDGSWGVKGIRRVPYRLPAVLAAVAASKRIWIVEGERDVHAMEAAGQVATCNSGGAGKWQATYSEHLVGAHVVVVADNDQAGEKHALAVKASVERYARKVSIVKPAEGKDARDHLAAGLALREFVPWTPAGWSDAKAATLRNPNPGDATPVTWAWEGRIPIGRASLVVGSEGVGKGTVIAWLASNLSRGQLAGNLYGTPADVLIVGDEDALEDTWTPRLYTAGAEWRHIWFPPEDCAELDLTNATDIERLRRWVRAHRVRVVIFDALLDHIGGTTVDEYKPKAVRNALRPLRRLALEEGFAAVGSMHPRKGNAGSFRDLLAGSHQFNAISRSSLLLAEHPDDDTRRVLIRGKGNLAGGVKALEFRIRSHAFELNGHDFDMPHAVDWEESDLKVADVLPGRGSGAGRPRDEDKREAVEAVLTGTPQSARSIAKAAEVARSTVQDILAELAEDGHASKLDDGWVAGNSGPLITGHPQGSTDNGSTKPNQVAGNVSGGEPSHEISDHPNGHRPVCSCVDAPPVSNDGRCSRCFGAVIA
jgi:AAA domain-containing protein/Toprim domain-containing protein